MMEIIVSVVIAVVLCGFVLYFCSHIHRDHKTKRAIENGDISRLFRVSEDNETNEDDLEIFQNVLDFSHTKVKDCMVPRTEIVAVPVTATKEELTELFVESGFSKLIVYDKEIDNILGYIHSSEMFRHPENWIDYIQKMSFVPETMGAQNMLHLFMQEKKSLAVVVDEFGGTVGIVSMEDLVEEIFGDIQDEHDTTNYVAKQVNEREYILSARLEIEKVNEMFDLDLPISADYQTLGGLILHYHQSFPKLHEEIIVGRYHMKVIRMTAKKIELVRLNLL